MLNTAAATRACRACKRIAQKFRSTRERQQVTVDTPDGRKLAWTESLTIEPLSENLRPTFLGQNASTDLEAVVKAHVSEEKTTN